MHEKQQQQQHLFLFNCHPMYCSKLLLRPSRTGSGPQVPKFIWVSFYKSWS